MTTQERLQGDPLPYRARLRAAVKALCWWKPWYSYYGLLDGAQWYGCGEYDKGYEAGVVQGQSMMSVRSAGGLLRFNEKHGVGTELQVQQPFDELPRSSKP